MRNVFMPPLDWVFSPKLVQIAKFLPDVTSIDVTFYPISPSTLFDSHLINTMSVRFRNDKKLDLEGIYLWKFRDSIPPQLGTDAHGYDDNNIYSSDYTESMMQRIRAAHDVMFSRDTSGIFKVKRPVSAHIDLDAMSFQKILRISLSKELSDKLHSWLEDDLPSFDESIMTDIRTWIREETSAPMFELGFKDLGNGYVGREPVFKTWPDLNALSYKDFSLRSSAKTHPGAPIHMSQSDLFGEIVDRYSPLLLQMSIKRLVKSKPGWLPDLLSELKLSSSHIRTRLLIGAINKSEQGFVAHNILWTQWHKWLSDRTIGQILQ